MTDAADIPALDPRVWGVKPPAQTLSRAEQAAACVIEQLAAKAGPSNRIGSKDDLRAVTAVSSGHAQRGAGARAGAPPAS